MSADLSKLTTGEFLHTLREVVAEKGAGYVYPESEKDDTGSCRYRYEGKPSCIIGHVLDRLGFGVGESWEQTKASFVLRPLGASPSVQRLADAAQLAQDEGRSWGEALAEAERLVTPEAIV